jgi:hypothetical protein
MTTTPPEVCSVAVATADALPVAFVSLVMAFAVAMPVAAAAGNAVALRGSVATAVPGAAAVPAKRKTRFPLVPISAVTAFVAACNPAAKCVTAIVF